MASGLSWPAGRLPALKASIPCARAIASARMLRAELPVHKKRAFKALMDRAGLVLHFADKNLGLLDNAFE